MEEENQNISEQPQSQEQEAPQGESQGSRGIVKMMVFFLIVLILFSVGYFFRGAIGTFFSGFFGGVDQVEKESITIAYAEGLTSFNPTNYEARNRNFLGNVYEGLTRFDKNLALEPALAVSWGQVEDLIWEFKLRDNVIFHDGSSLDSTDVAVSIEYAVLSEDSQLVSLLDSIDSIEMVDSLTVRIVTKEIDPILPNRLAQVYIFPSENDNFEANLVGTGPYFGISYDTYTSVGISEKLTLNAFSYYWGYYPSYDEVNLIAVPDKDDRKELFLAGDIDLLANVALDVVSELEEVVTQPSLEVNFLLFNTSGLFEEKELREAFSMAIDKEGLSEELNGYVEVADQFVPPGVSGYDSSILGVSYDSVAAEAIFEKYEVSEVEIDMADGLQFLGEYVISSLEEIGVEVSVDYWDVERYQEEIYNYAFDIYFMGWKCELGDAGDLYETVFGSDGVYNGGYSNDEVDDLITEVASEVDEGERLKLLKEIMGFLIEDIAGVPLFESEIIYGVAEGVEFEPRVDGYIFAKDLG